MERRICAAAAAAMVIGFACTMRRLTAAAAGKSLSSSSACNMFEGRWVFEESYPLYNYSTHCPFIRHEFNCIKNGRTNLQFLKYRWQPKACHLPRFEGKKMLRRFKGKKIMFIGDSLSANHHESLRCLLHAAVSLDSNLTLVTKGEIINTTIFKDYEVEISMFHTNFLVDIEKDVKFGRVLKLHSLKNGAIWNQADVLIFNTWQWWSRRGKTQPWDYIEYNGKIVKDMNRVQAYSTALDTWAKWVDKDVNSTKTKVIFQALTPSHYKGTEWGNPKVKNCRNETTPVMSSTYPVGLPLATEIVKQVQRRMAKPFYLLDITKLSQLKKDGHPAIYSGLYPMDCTHWCLAGVPDTWSHILYSHLISTTRW